jgi:cytochrome b561
MMLGLPLTGYAHRVAGNNPVTFFGLWNWPSLFAPSEPVRLLSGTIHLSLVIALAGLLALHFGAVLKHLVINRDGVAGRMV